MKVARSLLAGTLLLAAAATAWVVTRDASSSAGDCAPGDVACLAELIESSSGDLLADRAEVLADAVRLSPQEEDSICGSLGYGLGNGSTNPSKDLDEILRPDNTLPCRSALLSGVLDAVITGEPDRSSAERLLGRCSGSTDLLCAEAVGVVAAAVLDAPDAARTCYRLDREVTQSCLTMLLQRLVDSTPVSDQSDPRESLIDFCNDWQLNEPAQDCFAAAGPVFFTPAFGSLGFSVGAVDPEPLIAAVSFCERFGEGSLDCQRAAYPLAIESGKVGASASTRRESYCAVFAESLRDGCANMIAEPSTPVSPG